MSRLLLDNGAAVSAVDRGGGTALHCAAFHGFEGVVWLLLAHGAGVSAKDIDGRTPLHEAAGDVCVCVCVCDVVTCGGVMCVCDVADYGHEAWLRARAV